MSQTQTVGKRNLERIKKLCAYTKGFGRSMFHTKRRDVYTYLAEECKDAEIAEAFLGMDLVSADVEEWEKTVEEYKGIARARREALDKQTFGEHYDLVLEGRFLIGDWLSNASLRSDIDRLANAIKRGDRGVVRHVADRLRATINKHKADTTDLFNGDGSESSDEEEEEVVINIPSSSSKKRKHTLI